MTTNLMSLFVLAMGFLGACAAQPDTVGTGYPGSCKISCRKASIGADEMRVRFLTGPTLNLQCSEAPGDGFYAFSVPIRFVIEKPARVLPINYQSTDAIPPNPPLGPDLPKKSNTDGTTNDSLYWSPVAGVSFYPLLLAGDGDIFNQEDYANGTGRFLGIATPQEEWCTDTCGMGSIEIRPRCYGKGMQGSLFRIGVFSGNLNSTLDITMNQPG